MTRLVALLCSLLLVSGCASPAAQSCGFVGKPTVASQSIAWHLFDVTVLSQVSQGLNVKRWVSGPPPACNLPDEALGHSSFIASREPSQMSPEEVRWGPTPSGQALVPPFVIIRHKHEGKTAGFFVEDATGARYLFKLDVIGFPELVTGAEVVTSKLLFALGYHVPSYEIVEAPISAYRLGPTVKLTEAELQALLASRAQDGMVRASASRLLDGEILGPVHFKQYRCCAELRALRLAYAWVNNTDAKDHNSLIVWRDGHAIGYLIDFGSALGASAEHGPKTPCQGWIHDVEFEDWTLEVLTLGLFARACEARPEPVWSLGVGRLPARFDPRGWKPYAPNLAFEDLTEAEARWMATRLAQWSREQLEAAVSAGRYRDPADAGRLVKLLDARRQAVVDAYLTEEAH